MKQLACLILLGIISMTAFAQSSVVGTSPSNNATNVPLQTTIKVWFGAPIDTTQFFTQFSGYITSIDTIVSQTYSANSDTMYLSVRLGPSTAYFIVFYWLPGQGEFSIPYGYAFTTGSSFTGTTVSGTVTSNAPGTVTGAYAIVGLSDVSLVSDQPHFVAGTIADADGNFTLPYVPNGTFYPVAAKDVVPDGNIDPSTGDAVGFGTPINVTGSPIIGLPLVLNVGSSMSYETALDSAAAFQSAYLPGSQLRRISAYRADSLGNSLSDWQFYYYLPASSSVIQVNVQPFFTGAKAPDSWTQQAIPLLRTITNPNGAASPSVFIANCEAQGGLAFRQQSVPGGWNFYRTIQLGQLSYSNIPYYYVSDTTSFFWMADYHFDIDVTQDSSVSQRSMWFIGDYSTGAILSAADVTPADQQLPGRYALDQNYPNPFNPSTVVSYQLPAASDVRLVVYDVIGREVAVLVNEQQSPGTYNVRFDASGLASGLYFYRLTAGNFVQARKMLLMK
jgi:hypothetical protein